MRIVKQVLFGGKMRTIAQETAPRIALRSCSQEAGVGEEVRVEVILVKELLLSLSVTSDSLQLHGPAD